jgi:hypothetical protein
VVMKATIYIETTVVSYLVARPSRDLVTAALQRMTQEWWESRHDNYDLHYSDAMHIAFGAVYEMGYLLTWNCRHINNIDRLAQIAEICIKKGCKCPKICSPEQMSGLDETGSLGEDQGSEIKARPHRSRFSAPQSRVRARWA